MPRPRKSLDYVESGGKVFATRSFLRLVSVRRVPAALSDVDARPQKRITSLRGVRLARLVPLAPLSGSVSGNLGCPRASGDSSAARKRQLMRNGGRRFAYRLTRIISTRRGRTPTRRKVSGTDEFGCDHARNLAERTGRDGDPVTRSGPGVRPARPAIPRRGARM